jgi:hypothetical protein
MPVSAMTVVMRVLVIGVFMTRVLVIGVLVIVRDLVFVFHRVDFL